MGKVLGTGYIKMYEVKYKYVFMYVWVHACVLALQNGKVIYDGKIRYEIYFKKVAIDRLTCF